MLNVDFIYFVFSLFEYANSNNFTLSLNDVCMCVKYIALLAIYCLPYENISIIVLSAHGSELTYCRYYLKCL